MIWAKFQRDSNSHLGFCIYTNFCKHSYISSMSTEIWNEFSRWIIHSVDSSRQVTPAFAHEQVKWYNTDFKRITMCLSMSVVISVILCLNMPWPSFQKSPMHRNYSISPMKVAVGVHSFEYCIPPLLCSDISIKLFLKFTE